MSDLMTKPIASDLMEGLRAIVGDKGLVTDSEAIKFHNTDRYGVIRGHGAAVVKPATTEEVAAVVRFCNARNLKIVPQGGLTGLMAAAAPCREDDEVLVSLARMNRILDINPDGYSMTLEAGCVLQTIQEVAAEHDRFFPLRIGSQGSCMIGGNISTNAGGVNVLHYGNTRTLVLGLEVVLPDGRIWDGMRALKKDNTGYHLKELFMGAEGTLGIVTKAVLKLFPKPKDVATAWIAVRDPAAAIQMLSEARGASSDNITSCELMNSFALESILKYGTNVQRPIAGTYDWYVLMEWSSPRAAGEDTAGSMMQRMEAYLGDCFERGLALDATLAQSHAQARNMWAIREGGSGSTLRRPSPSCSFDVSVAVNQIPDFIARADAAALKAVPGVRPRPGGHIGDGNIHYNFTAPEHITTKAEFAPMVKVLSEIVCDMAAELNGSFSAEHGIGVIKVMELEHYRSDVELDIMRAIKKALDPKHLMNPGKVIRLDTNEKALPRGTMR
jgi:FAD/FMN-containing dehydrogenase